MSGHGLTLFPMKKYRDNKYVRSWTNSIPKEKNTGIINNYFFFLSICPLFKDGIEK